MSRKFITNWLIIIYKKASSIDIGLAGFLRDMVGCINPALWQAGGQKRKLQYVLLCQIKLSSLLQCRYRNSIQIL
ncbi:hypothetical protein C7475_11461 [Chitinophaga sp. S165]|nr:hypothetical protein C7475_11461 [Chitinophaga sp. S165]